MARPLFDSEFIHGLHDPGGENHMLDLGKPGWVLFTFAVGRDPGDHGGFDFRPWSDRGLGVIARLNHGYHPDGTLPASVHYPDFARRCANFAGASQGCAIWVVGNETNFISEQPPLPGSGTAGDGGSPSPGATPSVPPVPAPVPPTQQDPHHHGDPTRFSALRPGLAAGQDGAPTTEAITPERYLTCYRLCRQAIRALPGHGADQVVVGAVAPWNNQTSYAGNPNGDWVRYFQDILRPLGPSGCDGFAIHSYTHGTNPDLVESEARMNPPFQNRHFHFRAFQDWLEAVPATMRNLPVYLTEMDQDDPWLDENNGWVQRTYAEIERWNARPGAQQVRAAILYRWPQADRWFIDGKGNVIDAFRQVVAQGLRWRAGASGGGGPVGGGSPGGGGTGTGGAPSLRVADLGPGGVVAPTRSVNLRRSPGFAGKPASDVVAVLPAGLDLGLVVAARTPRDGLSWRRIGVALPAGVVFGWVAETAPGGAALLTGVRAAPPLAAGEEAISITTVDVNLRRSPGHVGKPASDIVGQLRPGERVRLVAGPVGADGLPWWRIDDGPTGERWVAERAPNGGRFLGSAAFAVG